MPLKKEFRKYYCITFSYSEYSDIISRIEEEVALSGKGANTFIKDIIKKRMVVSILEEVSNAKK